NAVYRPPRTVVTRVGSAIVGAGSDKCRNLRNRRRAAQARDLCTGQRRGVRDGLCYAASPIVGCLSYVTCTVDRVYRFTAGVVSSRGDEVVAAGRQQCRDCDGCGDRVEAGECPRVGRWLVGEDACLGDVASTVVDVLRGIEAHA